MLRNCEDKNELKIDTQASRIIAKFGGARRLASILASIGKPRDPSSIYKWAYPKEKDGTGGLIPTSAWPDIISAARYDGVVLTLEDLDPRPKLPKPVKPSPDEADLFE